MILHFFLFPLFLVLLVCLGTFFSFVLAKSMGLDGELIDDLGLKGIMGAFFLGMLGIVGNFFIPLSSLLFLVVPILFLLRGLVLQVKFRKNVSRLEIICLGILAVLLAPMAGSLGPGYDGGLYHLPHQLWLRTEPIVIGLANLHGRFGFA